MFSTFGEKIKIAYSSLSLEFCHHGCGEDFISSLPTLENRKIDIINVILSFDIWEVYKNLFP
jgi:hypothetical protein